jgi:hypothetical protein
VAAAAAERLVVALRAGTSLHGLLGGVLHLVAVAGAMALLVRVNPYGWDYAKYLWRALRMHRDVIEWAPIWDPRISRWLLFGFVVSIAIAVYAARRAGLGAVLGSSGWAFVLLAAPAAGLSTRHLSVYAIAWLTWVAPLVARTPAGAAAESWWRWRPAVFAATSIAFLTVGAGCAVSRRAWTLEVPARPETGDLHWYPVGAVDYLARVRFSGRLLTRFQDGSYVSWRLHPAVKVSFDSRYEAVYPPGTLERHAHLFGAAPGWQDLLARDAAEAILVPRTSPLDAALEGTAAGWVRVYRDEVDSVWVRSQIAAALTRALQ